MQLKKLFLLLFFFHVRIILFAGLPSDSTEVLALLKSAEQCIKAGNNGCQKVLSAAMQKATLTGSHYLQSLCYGMQSLSQRRYRSKQLIGLDQQALEEARMSGNDSLVQISLYRLTHDYGILGDIDNASNMLSQFSGKLENKRNRVLKMRGFYEWGYCLYRKLDFDGAREKFMAALNLANSMNDIFWIALLKRSVFQSEVLGYFPEKQTAYLFDALSYFIPLNNVETANSQAIAGRTFLLNGNTAKAREYYTAALSMYNRSNYPIEQGETLISIAEVCLAEKNDRAGFAATAKARSIFKKYEWLQGWIQACLLEARLYNLAGKEQLAVVAFNEADSILNINPDKRLRYLYLGSRLEYYRNIRKLNEVPRTMMDSLVKLQRELMPLAISMRMAERARQSGLLSVQEMAALKDELLGHKADTFSFSNDAEQKGFNPLTINQPELDSLHAVKFNRQLTEMETRYRVREVKDSLDKATTVARLTQKQVQLKNWIIGLVSGLVLVAFAFLFMINRQKNRAIADRNTIDVLRGELQHRAAGALNTVIALLNIEKRKSAGNASLIALESRVTPLIGLFHSFNTHAGENMSIQKRLGELASFYKGIFNAEYQVDVIIQAPDLTEQRKADKLLLAVGELMLNSYKYAFEKGKQGLIKIDASIDPDNTYMLSYTDNGNGLPDGPIKPKGGLASVKAVVETLNGTLNLVNEAGFRAELKFPV